MIDFYCGVNETKWNHHEVNPGPLVCIAPVYGRTKKTKKENRVRVPEHVKIRADSGAFSDASNDRLSFAVALERNLKHAEKYHYQNQVEAIASYDLLIDEKWENGERYKRRWTENDAWEAVRITVDAAKFLSKHYQGKRILSAQGVTPKQYMECSAKILEWFDTEQDIFGLGGWCISGKMPTQMRSSFDGTMLNIIPSLAKANVKKVHIWGVTDVTFLGPLLWLCDQHNIKLATDGSGPQMRPAMGEWGFRGWRNKNYTAPPVEIRGIHRAIHVQLYRCRLNTLRQSEYYHVPGLPDAKKNQKRLF